MTERGNRFLRNDDLVDAREAEEREGSVVRASLPRILLAPVIAAVVRR